MESQQIVDVLRRFSRFANPFGKWVSELSLLKKDLHLSAEYKLHDAVDFAEVFLHSYPSVEKQIAIEKARRSHTNFDENQFRQHQVALTVMFREGLRPLISQKLVLLPPHMLELQDNIDWAARYLEDFTSQIHLQDAGVLPKAGISADIIPILDKSKDGAELTDSEAGRIVKYVSAHYRDMYDLLLLNPKPGLERMKKVLGSGGSIVSLEEALPDLHIEFDQLKRRGQDIFDRINIVRPRPERTYSNYIDALACAYILLVNERVNTNGIAMFIITHSYAVQQALKNTEIELHAKGQIVRVPIVRSLDHAVAYLIHKGNSMDETYELVDESLRLATPFTGFKLQYPQVQALAEREDLDRLSIGHMNELIKGNIAEACEKITSIMDAFEILSKTNSYANLIMASARVENSLSRHLNEVIVELDEQSRVEASRALQIVNLTRRDPAVVRRLEDELEDVTRDLGEDGFWVSYLRQLQYGDYPPIHEFAQTQKKQSIRSLGGSLRDTCYEPRLENQDFLLISEGLLGKGAWQKPGDVEKGYRQLFSAVSEYRGQPEPFILLAFLLGKPRKWSYALAVVDAGLEKYHTPDQNRAELLFWKAVIMRSMSEQKLMAALECCSEALAMSEDDPRFLCEQGVLKWRLWPGGNGVELLGEAIASLQKARAVLEENEGHKGRRELFANINAILAHVYATRGEESDLVTAERLIRQVETLVEKGVWPALFHDTLGFVYYLDSLQEAGDKRARLLDLAEQEAESAISEAALKGGFTPLWQKRLFAAHLKSIRDARKASAREN